MTGPTDPARSPSAPALLIGHGYDLHRLEPIEAGGRPLVLGGITIPHDRGPVSHSDGDALLHAVTDALLGSIGQPDIGQLFPDNAPENESRDSAVFLEDAMRRLAGAGYRPVNIDATVILERPKLSPHKDAIRSNLAALLRLDPARVNLKGKTHEKVDAVGEGRAVEVHCVVLVERVLS